MPTPVEIAYRRCQASDRVRTEIDAQTQRLEKLGRNITGCRVVVTGPGEGSRAGEGFHVQLRIALPEHREVIVGRTDSDPGHESALVAVRAAFEVARRRLEDAEREMRGEVKVHASATRGLARRGIVVGG